MTASYSTRIKNAVEDWCSSTGTRMELDYLAFLLDVDPTENEVGQTPEDREIGRRSAWVKLLRHDDLKNGPNTQAMNNYLVAGLLENERWRDLLGSEDDTCLLVHLINSIHRDSTDGAMNALRLPTDDLLRGRVARADVDTLLGQWVQKDVVSTRDFAVHLFGEAWALLVYDDHPAGVALGDIISSTRPAFREGLLTTDVVQEPLKLPFLGEP